MQAPYHGQSVFLLDAQPAQVMAQETFALHVLHARHAELWNPLTGAPLQRIQRVRALRPDLSAGEDAELRALWGQEESAGQLSALAERTPSRAVNPMSATLMDDAPSALEGWGGEPTSFEQDFSLRMQSVTDLLQGMSTTMDLALGRR